LGSAGRTTEEGQKLTFRLVSFLFGLVLENTQESKLPATSLGQSRTSNDVKLEHTVGSITSPNTKENTPFIQFPTSASYQCLKGTAPSYFSEYFQLKRHNIDDYDIRNKDKLVIERIKLESTKRAFFYKGADIFNNCI